MVLARRASGNITFEARGAYVVKHGKIVALVEVAVFNNLVDGGTTLVAEFGDGKKLRVGTQLLDRDTIDVVPSLALTA